MRQDLQKKQKYFVVMKENAEKCYERLAINNDYDAFWDKVYVCIDKNTYNKYLEEYA